MRAACLYAGNPSQELTSAAPPQVAAASAEEGRAKRALERYPDLPTLQKAVEAAKAEAPAAAEEAVQIAER